MKDRTYKEYQKNKAVMAKLRSDERQQCQGIGRQ